MGVDESLKKKKKKDEKGRCIGTDLMYNDDFMSHADHSDDQLAHNQ